MSEHSAKSKIVGLSPLGDLTWNDPNFSKIEDGGVKPIG